MRENQVLKRVLVLKAGQVCASVHRHSFLNFAVRKRASRQRRTMQVLQKVVKYGPNLRTAANVLNT